MPRRKLDFKNEETYHVFNTSADATISPFDKDEYLKRAVTTTKYYQFDELPLKLSVFLSQSDKTKEKVLSKLVQGGDRLVEIVAYCFVPAKFEFLLTQKKDEGISTFMARFQNSYTRFFNSKESRKGRVFAGQFRAKHTKDREIAEISKKIHILPEGDPFSYEWSSISSYFEENHVFTKPEKALSFFENKEEYKSFVKES
jgi:hypothetical protein